MEGACPRRVPSAAASWPGRRACPRRARGRAPPRPGAPAPPPRRPPRDARSYPVRTPARSHPAARGGARSCRCRGDLARSHAAPSGRGSSSRDLARLEQRRVARHEQHAVVSARERVPDPDQRGRRLARLSTVVEHVTRSAARPTPAALSAVTTTISSSSGTRAGACRARRRTSPGRGPAASPPPARRQGAAWQRRSSSRGGWRSCACRARSVQPQPLRERAKSSSSRASPARSLALVHERVRDERGQARHRLVGHDPVEHARRTRAAMPAALGSIPACSQNASVGPFSERPPMNGLTATTGAGRRAQRLAHSGQREDRADRDHRVGRADHDRLGLGHRLEHRVGRLGRARGRAARPPRPDPRRAPRS